MCRVNEKKISNTTAEKSVIAGLIQHGRDSFDDIDGMITVDSFTLEENQIMWSCLQELFEKSTVDLPTLHAASKALDLDSAFSEKVPKGYFSKLKSVEIEKSNVPHQARIVAILQAAREVHIRASQVQSRISRCQR